MQLLLDSLPILLAVALAIGWAMCSENKKTQVRRLNEQMQSLRRVKEEWRRDAVSWYLERADRVRRGLGHP